MSVNAVWSARRSHRQSQLLEEAGESLGRRFVGGNLSRRSQLGGTVGSRMRAGFEHVVHRTAWRIPPRIGEKLGIRICRKQIGKSETRCRPEVLLVVRIDEPDRQAPRASPELAR
jgi:hypothetical protein